ncbi:MAG: bifunctional 4-hydroxy-2-oxoglutarate aldolase/2-dehydro-3-deoxy-phosphogluconate aldolase [Verrucomicrobiota bacterium]
MQAVEIALRTPAALGALERCCSAFPEMIVGAGTVLTADQAKSVKDAGATFAVSPGLNPTTVEATQDLDLPFAPGVITPSDIELAVSLGCRTLKLFPAGPMGGLDYLKVVAAPFSHLGVRFIPLGGINAANARAYVSDPHVLAIGGSWLASPAAIEAADWAGVEQRSREAIDLVTT